MSKEKVYLHKDGAVKIIDGEERIKMLKSLGWEEETKVDEKAELFAKAESLGLNPDKRFGVEKLKAMIEESE